jgi:hypothetical protein
MLTAARRHAIAVAVRKDAGKPGALSAPQGEYRMQLMQLGEDLRRLSQIQSIERKIAAKREMLPRFKPWIDAALAADSPAQDEIFTTVLIWTIDVADWPQALRLARHVLAHGLALPERYRRDAATLIAEEFATAGLTPTPTVDLTTLQQVDDLTAGADMPDEVRAKLKKAIGLALRARLDAFDPHADAAMAGGKPALIATTLSYFTRALALDPKCGVKAMIQQLTREAKKSAGNDPG